MKKTLVSVAGALALVVAISVVPVNTNLGLLSPDVVSAASEAAPAPPTTTTKTTTTKTSTTKTSSTLRYGSKGTAVKTLQTSLNKNGAKLKVDGKFGPKTLAAVKAYQKKYGLKVDGLVGPKTIAMFVKTSPNTTTPPVVTPPVVTPPADAVTSASVTDNEAVFEKSIGTEGKWIIATTKNLTFTKALVLDGTFKNGKKNSDGSDQLQRKIALYTQSTDGKYTVLDRFTLTAPKITIKSPNARIQGGTFKGDVYVTTPDFSLVDARVEGNVYFTTQAAKDGFKNDKSVITGQQILMEPDAVTSASIASNETVFEKALGTADMGGKWIICTVRDLYYNKELVLVGNIYKPDTTPSDSSQRKIALYSQYTDTTVTPNKKVKTRDFTLTAPKLTIKTPYARTQNGIFKGDLYVAADHFTLLDTDVYGNIYVSANNFKIDAAKVTGNIYYTTQAYKDTATIVNSGTVTGVQEVKAN